MLVNSLFHIHFFPSFISDMLGWFPPIFRSPCFSSPFQLCLFLRNVSNPRPVLVRCFAFEKTSHGFRIEQILREELVMNIIVFFVIYTAHITSFMSLFCVDKGYNLCLLAWLRSVEGS